MHDYYSPYAVNPTRKRPQKIYGDEIIDWNQEDWKEIMPSIMGWDRLSHEAFQFDHKLQRCKSLSLDRMKKCYIEYVEPPPPLSHGIIISLYKMNAHV